AAGAVGHKRLPVLVECVTPTVNPPACEDVEFGLVRVKSPDATGVETLYAGWGFDVAVNVNRLVEVEAAVWSPAECVDDVVRVFGAEAAQQYFLLVGFAAGL